MKKILFVFAALAASYFLYEKYLSAPSSAPSESLKILKIGVTAGPHATIVNYLKPLAKEKGFTIHVIEFDDFVLPNAALNQGDIHMNIYQHEPYLAEQVKSRKYKIKSIGKTVLMPMGAYSVKHKQISELPEGAKIGIPNDPSNSVRALLLLEKAGLITLAADQPPSIYNISSNPKKLDIKELDPPRLPRALEDLNLAVINTDWILVAKMNPESAIVREDATSPYVNVMVVREGTENDPMIQEFVKIYQSNSVRNFIQKTFAGAVIPAF